MRDTPQDFHNKILGKRGERAAARELKKRGGKILARNYKTPFGEADLIVQMGETLVFCEVKTRLNERFGTGAEAVERHKQRRYRDIARFYMMRLGREVRVRFDVAEVYPDRVNVIEGAF